MRLFFLSLAVVVPGLAYAQGAPPAPTDCLSDADCAAGEVCALSDCGGGPQCDPADPNCQPTDCGSGGVCVAAPPPPTECTTDADCAEGEQCQITDCARPCDPADPTCEPVECSNTGFCAANEPPPPAECLSDADCTNGDVCITETFGSCSSSGCACPDDGDGDPSNDPPCECDAPPPPDCTEETYSFCGPRYLDDCTADADCGAGFTCEAADACTCAVSSDGSEPVCDCAPSTELSCVLTRVECTADSDCAEGLVCVDEAANAPCVVDEAGNTSCDTRDTAGTRICAPEGFVGGGVAVEARADDQTDDDSDLGDDVDSTNIFIDCSQTSAAGTAPFALVALAFGLARRRRQA